jgi:hypothetical protein
VRVSVIVASRLQPRPGAGSDALWLDRALRSGARQSAAPDLDLEVVVGLDPGAQLPPRLAGVVAAPASRPGQAAALNAAVAAAGGDVLAFLEDDDYWEARRLAYGLARLGRYDLVTSSQREVDADGGFVGLNDYPTPSGWLLGRTAWEAVGPFDEGFTFVDSEWLGRANAAGLRRLHLAEAGAPDRPGLRQVAQYSALASTAERDPLVLRTANPDGVMGAARADAAMRARREADVRRLVERFGGIPW